jgi:hypothetical protein
MFAITYGISGAPRNGGSSATAIWTAPRISRSRPDCALASYQTDSSANVAATRRPYQPFGGTVRRMSGTARTISSTPTAVNVASIRVTTVGGSLAPPRSFRLVPRGRVRVHPRRERQDRAPHDPHREQRTPPHAMAQHAPLPQQPRSATLGALPVRRHPAPARAGAHVPRGSLFPSLHSSDRRAAAARASA